MSAKRYSILGNSVSLLVDPYRVTPDYLTYSELIRAAGNEVWNVSRQASVVTDLYSSLEEDCLTRSPDVVVLQFGIVEATSRLRGRRTAWRLSGIAWKNTVTNGGYDPPTRRVLKRVIHHLMDRWIERPLMKLGIRFRWVSLRAYETAIRDICRAILKETVASQIVLVGIHAARAWLERVAPGTSRAIARYNGVMESISDDFAAVAFVPVPNDPESTDGIHLSPAGHRRLAESILSLSPDGGRPGEFTQWMDAPVYAGLVGKLYENRRKRK